MKPDQALERHLRWKRKFVQDESRSNMPGLRMLQSPIAQALLSILDAEPATQRLADLQLLAQRFTAGLGSTPQLSSAQQDRVMLIIAECSAKQLIAGAPPVRSSTERRYVKHLLRTSVIPSLEAIVGGVAERWGGGNYCVVSSAINGSYLITDIDLGSSSCDISLVHRLGVTTGPPFLLPQTSVAEWYGIAYDATWCVTSVDDVDTCIDSVCRCAALGWQWANEIVEE